MNRKLLIADDEVHIRMLLEQILEDLEDDGVELIFTDNGEKALEIIVEQRPSLVFLDVMMPRMNGMEVCARVKENPDLKNICIVLLTAKGQEIDRQKGNMAGGNFYLTKPFDPDQLLEMVKKVLEI